MELIDELYSPEKAKLIKSLCSNEKDKQIIITGLGKSMMDCPKILQSKSIDQLMATLSLANFSYDKDEPMIVSGIIRNQIRNKNILPRIIDHISDDPYSEAMTRTEKYLFGSKCLISLAFFYDALVSRSVRQGAPSPEFYREFGSSAFDWLGMYSLSRNFKNWEDFIRDNLVNSN